MHRLLTFVFVAAYLSGASLAAHGQTRVGSFSGRVLDAQGAAVTNASITLTAVAGDMPKAQRASTDSAGTFVFEGVADGQYVLLVTKDGFARNEQSLSLNSERRTLEIRLDPALISESVTITAQSYEATTATTATRLDVPLRDIPQSIQVITRQVLDDQKVVRLKDAVQNVSGVLVATDYGGHGDNLIIRGFPQDYNFRDGFRDGDVYRLLDTANVEQVEVLKGPASVLYGQAQPGGIVNLVTKQPLSDYAFSFQALGGNYGYFRPTLDLSGPLNHSKTLLFRVNGAYQHADSFRDFVTDNRNFIAPVITFAPTDRTKLTLDYEYLNDRSTYDGGIPALGDRPAPVPINTFYGIPFSKDRNVSNKGRIVAEQQINDRFSIRVAGFGSHVNTQQYQAGSFGILPDDRTVFRYEENWIYWKTQTFGAQVDLTANFKTGEIKHTVLTGSEATRYKFDYQGATDPNFPPIDLYTPVYSIPVTDTLNSSGKISTDQLGFYAQDLVTVTPEVKVLVGGRYSLFDQRSYFGVESLSPDRSDLKDSAFSPRVGVVYQPTERVSLYASYARSFNPVSGRSATGEVFKPETGTQYEAGIRASLWRQRLSGTLAVFQITKTNVATTDPRNPGFSIQVGEQRSRGLEIDLAGRLTDNWNVTASYALTDAIITQDNLLTVGARLGNIPRHSGNLWTVYEFNRTRYLRGFGIGTGFYAVGPRVGPSFIPGDLPFFLPGYLRVDAMAFYKIPSDEKLRYRFGLNIRNLFDRIYYESAAFRGSIYPGAPFTVIGSFQISR